MTSRLLLIPFTKVRGELVTSEPLWRTRNFLKYCRFKTSAIRSRASRYEESSFRAALLLRTSANSSVVPPNTLRFWRVCPFAPFRVSCVPPTDRSIVLRRSSTQLVEQLSTFQAFSFRTFDRVESRPSTKATDCSTFATSCSVVRVAGSPVCCLRVPGRIWSEVSACRPNDTYATTPKTARQATAVTVTTCF